MGSIPRSTKALEIPTTNIEIFPALATHSSSTNRFHPSKECRLCACSSASFTSHTSRSISYRERRIWCSSNIRLKLMECSKMEVKARVRAR
jgi:hypothetical protein